MTGEIDIANRDELALAAVPAGAALVSLAQQTGLDHRLIVHDAPHVLRTLLKLGWPQVPESAVGTG